MDEEKLKQAGFELQHTANGRQRWQVSFVKSHVGHTVVWVFGENYRSAYLLMQIGGNEDCVSLPNITTVDEAITAARLLARY